ncbi:helix-turn-helix domain-containing protein [Streptomyces albus]|uniref:helix-turn-helix domain-containing protein n=1 Tax=Streptomyces albus TaxID=1888 RepID=UPI003D15C2FD
MSNAAIARSLGRHVDTIRAWHKRFAAEGDGGAVRAAPAAGPSPDRSRAVPEGDRRGYRGTAGRYSIPPSPQARTSI